MELTMNAQDLLDGLNIVTRALSARPAKQILEGVLIEATDSGINLVCSDGNLTIENALTGTVKDTGRAVLPGKLFAELARKLPSGNVTIKVGSNHAAQFRCGAFRSTVAGMNAMEYPEMAEINAAISVDIQQNRLRDMISRVVFAIASDETRQILTGCLLEISQDQARMVALDGYRLAMQKLSQPFMMPEGKDMLKAIIPGRVLSELSRVLPDEETFATLIFDKNRMQCQFGNTKLTTVLLAGEYIDYRKILPTTFHTEARVSRHELQDAIDRASLMAREGKNNLVRLGFTEEKLTIASNAEMGDVYEEMGARLMGDPIEIAFNAKYLSDVIRNIAEDELCMKFNTAVSPCIFCPVKGDGFVYLLLPVRVFNS